MNLIRISRVNVPIAGGHTRVCFRQSIKIHKPYNERWIQASSETSEGIDNGLYQETIKATDLIAQLIQAPDPAAVAREHLDDLTPGFFEIAGHYAEAANKDRHKSTHDKLIEVMKIVWQVKQSALRPEIQFFNQLQGCKSIEARQKLLAAPEAQDILTMNNHYFFFLIKRLLEDMVAMAGEKPDERTQKNMNQLMQLQTDAMKCLPADRRPSNITK